MPRYLRKLAVLAKIEATYGVDAAPTGAADAMQMTNVTVEPMAGGEVARELISPYMGHQGVMLTGTHMTLAGDIELAGAGAAGTAPAWGPLIRACGWQQVITAATKVQYNLLSGVFEAASIYYNLDGVRHVGLGCRGNWSVSLAPSQIPRMRFELKGIAGTISDQVLPTVDTTKFTKPVVVSKANTSFTLHGLAAIAESISIQQGGKVEPRFLIGYEGIEITDRSVTATAVLEAGLLAQKDWFAIAKAETKDAMALQHGTVAGNIIELNGPKVQVGRPSQGGSQGIANYSLPLMMTPNLGNDELVLVAR